jgi:dTDP-4-dehydrorhamnose reductase
MGASGYVGRAVTAALTEVDTATVRDLSVEGPRPPLGPDDVVLNCVGTTGHDAARLREVNVDLAGRVAREAAAVGARLVHVSSAAVFDGVRCGVVDETTHVAPRTAYGRSKAAGELRVREEHPEACLVRPSKVIGGDDPRMRLHRLVAHVVRGGPLPVPSRRSDLWANFVAAADVGAVLAAVATEGQPAQTMHLAAPLELDTFLALLGEATGRPVRTLPGSLASLAGLAVTALGTVPPARRPRPAEQLLELWDRQCIRSLEQPLTSERLQAELGRIALAVRNSA